MNFTVQASFDEIARELHTTAGGQLRDREERWRFERRQGLIADELIAVAAGIRDAHPGDTVAIVVGSSSHARHRVVGSVAVILARRAPVPPRGRALALGGSDPIRQAPHEGLAGRTGWPWWSAGSSP